ncbi:dentin sialophosphoprotein-related [Forsythia ovata]|uniref:Dentin sialophosphoprotein-related n=1 Tax=Forsythia ovata TaxID=205694 RepID=A0ABD1R192_9LAMI
MSEVPHDLIRRIQISTRNVAGLSGYDPGDLTRPALPSLSATIASLEPSPPYLRCSHCKGRLLRGLQSFICVYCGNPHQNDVAPDPICFNSTIGYQWLLQSLQLDGSELIGPQIEKIEPNRAQSSSIGEIPLSDFLNFRIAWPAESQKQETSVSDKQPEQSKRSLNLTGVDLDSFFSEPKRDVSDRSVDQPVTSNKVKTSQSEVAAADNLNLFQNVQPSEPAVNSSEGKNVDSFSGWEAEFQSTGSENQHGGSNTPDLFISSSVDSGKKFQDTKSFDPLGSEVDLSAHMESLFGPGTNLNDGKLKDTSADSPAFGDWNSNDLRNNVSSNESQLAEGFDATFRATDDNILENSNYSSTNVDWFQDNQLKTNKMDEPENTILSRYDDSFDEWDDFTGSTSTQDPSKNALTQSDIQLSASLGKPSEIDLISSNNKFEEMDFGSFLQPDFFSGSSSNDNSSTKANTILQEVPASDRLVDTSGLSDDAENSEEVFGKSAKPNDDIAILISQMHDLSFMLKSDLSIPSKSDSHNASQQD